MPRKKKEQPFIDPTLPDTTTISLGSSEDLASHDPESVPFNLVLIHRHYEPVLQKWGNLCSLIVSKFYERYTAGKPIRWYHVKIHAFCYEQYDKYGDYYRILDNSFGTMETDEVREVG